MSERRKYVVRVPVGFDWSDPDLIPDSVLWEHAKEFAQEKGYPEPTGKLHRVQVSATVWCAEWRYEA